MTDTVKVFLIVEDDDDMRLLMALVLRKDPRLELVSGAATAEAALESEATLEPGLIILDHALGGSRTGIDLAPKLKARHPRAKILLFSAYGLRREAECCPAVDEFLDKGDVARLLPTVQRLLGLAL